ncbi:DinB family protein [Actinomycetospora cinnamomea]|uniref:DinB family protein n=1 Tax=Actinomycetospora cinnamomea TaxID=663609 RepID=A0A2U1EYD4_9PSEU|nr:DinB family protein [Actinomycetospora cinnamomea]PVZ04938.1 DinB family protein [Actinomycetospora cinnamomea]
MALEWNALVREQADWQWREYLRPRLDGLTDEQYLWEPAPGAWSVRPRDRAVTPMAAGAGEMVIDFAYPEPDPPPVTTVAWRLGHLIVGVLAMRVAGHFGGPPVDYGSHHYAATARGAIAQFDEAYAAWTAGVRALGEDGLAAPCGPSEGPYADEPMALLVLHINRELLHHGAEIALLLDLHRARAG